MKLTFLHISDLHYRSNWPEENGLVCERFFDDLKTQVAETENPHLIFSGDVVMAGSDPDLYSCFEKAFAARLESLGILKQHRICVPGNHDLSKVALKPHLAIQKGTLQELKDERTFNDNLPAISKLVLEGNFANYKSFESQFAKYTCCQSAIGGTGWELMDGVAVYCLNSALCSFGGIDDANGKPILDKNQLMVDTRSLHAWLAANSSKLRVLVMHHPTRWFAPWAESELERVIHNSFHVVFCGHTHENTAVFSTQAGGGSLRIIAPPLFTRKSALLGYSLVTIDVHSQTSQVSYRQWSPSQKFVPGTGLAGNETGKISFGAPTTAHVELEVLPPGPAFASTLDILQAEFDEARTCYSSKKRLWVDRDLADVPETAGEPELAKFTSAEEFAKSPRSCIIRSPKQFGLTCLGRFLALEHHRASANQTILVMQDAGSLPHHRSGLAERVKTRCQELKSDTNRIAGFILDNWNNDKGNQRLLREFKAEYPNKPIIVLAGEDDFVQVSMALEMHEENKMENLYLWALSRSNIRTLATSYIEGVDTLDEDLVTKKVTDDIDALNLHRTPLNCLLLLKLSEQAFEDTPVNRTEMIGRVLYLLFYQYNRIPRYATRPDLKDCEFALGYFCEALIRSGKTTFTIGEFYQKIQEYCSKQILDLDIEILFTFLLSENIFVKKGMVYEFRFIYWLYYFAAHRMHHDSQFAEFILSERRYSAFPEIIEFYAGIDRMRTDAVVSLAKDLEEMDIDFLKRSGIPSNFNPYKHAQWAPTEEAVEQLKRQLDQSLKESALPTPIKDAIADQQYNRAQPYNQALAKFIEESSLLQMLQATRGAARALRNSDHVAPAAKADLLEKVLRCWVRACQTLIVISPVLAAYRPRNL